MSSQSEINERLLFGEKGLLILSAGESSSSEAFCVIQSTENSVISVANVTNSQAIVSLTLIAGMALYGVFSEITVTSGQIVAYKR
jgi:hypothetical protein|tara:strand:- start:212 stop:466 length:255 start_codon:yes stop_codon:yes gene_type:complete